MEIRPHLSAKDIKQVVSRVATVAFLTLSFSAPLLACSNPETDSEESTQDRIYLQCGGGGYPESHTVEVTSWKDQKGRISKYNARDLGPLVGQCGNYAHPEPRTIPGYYPVGFGVPLGDSNGIKYDINRRYPQCGGELSRMVWPTNSVLLVEEFLNDKKNSAKYAVHDLGPIPGQCGNPVK